MAVGDVIIVCEAGKGQTEAANNRLIAAGLQLAQSGNGRLACLIAGEEVGDKATDFARFADEVWAAELTSKPYDSYAHLAAVRTLVDEIHPGVILFGHTYLGMDLAPRLAARLGVAAVSNCLSVGVQNEKVYVVRPMYRGRLRAKVAIMARPIVATLEPGGAEPVPSGRQGVVKTMTLPADPNPKFRPLRVIEPARTDVDIGKAAIVVAGGRGIGARENFALVNTLAEILGGVPACSRPLVDMGWFGTNYQVGLSGNTVKPRLYVACGISGAVEHLHGMKESETIVAINRDPEAPIFKVAHYGLVGDLNEIMPALITEVKSTKGAGSLLPSK
jgi:electron transfer flavoprotein alpha subunit